jgi:hypothetical protein
LTEIAVAKKLRSLRNSLPTPFKVRRTGPAVKPGPSCAGLAFRLHRATPIA